MCGSPDYVWLIGGWFASHVGKSSSFTMLHVRYQQQSQQGPLKGRAKVVMWNHFSMFHFQADTAGLWGVTLGKSLVWIRLHGVQWPVGWAGC
jgi:hypothetical protein